MPDRGLGNEVSSRQVLEQVAEAVIAKWTLEHPLPSTTPEPPKAEIPAPLKWAAVVAAAVMTLGVTGGITWGVSTLNTLQITVARMDERMQQDTTGQRVTENQKRIEKLEERLSRIEQRAQK